MDEIVVTAGGGSLSHIDYAPIQTFQLVDLTWTPLYQGQGATLYQQIAFGNQSQLVNTKITFSATDGSPQVSIDSLAGDSINTKDQRAEILGSVLSYGQKIANYSVALQELHDAGAKWDIILLDDASYRQQFGTGNSALTLGVTHDIAVAPGTIPNGHTFTTYIDAANAVDHALQDIVVHELGHLTRDSLTGQMRISEAAVNAIAPAASAHIDQLRVGATNGFTSSEVLTLGSGNNLVYGSPGNNVITSPASGNNTIVAYDGNTFIQTGAGNDYVQILGNGVKYLEDTGGVNTLYIGWAHKVSDIYTLNSETHSGIIYGDVYFYLSAIANYDTRTAPNTIQIKGWSTSGYKYLAFTDTTGKVVQYPMYPTFIHPSGPSAPRSDVASTMTTAQVPPTIPSHPNRVIGVPLSAPAGWGQGVQVNTGGPFQTMYIAPATNVVLSSILMCSRLPS